MEIGRRLLVLLIVVVVAAASFGISWNITHAAPKTQASSGPYTLTLVITTSNQYNTSTGDQPAFYVLNNGSLQSSAVIRVPADQNILLTIISYDDGAASPLGQPNEPLNATNPGVLSLYDVTGTVGNVEKVVNDTNVNSSQTSSIQVSGGQTVSTIPPLDVSHTFTVSQLGLNVPIPPSSTVITTLYFTQQGTYNWQCNAPCGTGPTGWGGAMSTQGWMLGTLNVVLF